MLCEYLVVRRVNKLVLPAKRNLSFQLVTLVRSRDIPMLLASLASLVRHTSGCPSICVVLDDQENLEMVQDAIEPNRHAIQLMTRDEVVRLADKMGMHLEAAFARRHHFGLKYAAIQVLARGEATVYADADLLYFKDIRSLIERPSDKPLTASLDYQHSYSPFVVAQAGTLYGLNLLSLKPINAGFTLWRGAFDPHQTAAMLTRILAQPEISLFDEQTLVASLAHRAGSAFGEDDVLVSDSFLTTSGPSCRNKPWSVRHYVGPVREQFWIDAFHLV